MNKKYPLIIKLISLFLIIQSCTLGSGENIAGAGEGIVDQLMLIDTDFYHQDPLCISILSFDKDDNVKYYNLFEEGQLPFHYLITRRGNIIQYVREDRQIYRPEEINSNCISIGIENHGHTEPEEFMAKVINKGEFYFDLHDEYFKDHVLWDKYEDTHLVLLYKLISNIYYRVASINDIYSIIPYFVNVNDELETSPGPQINFQLIRYCLSKNQDEFSSFSCMLKESDIYAANIEAGKAELASVNMKGKTGEVKKQSIDSMRSPVYLDIEFDNSQEIPRDYTSLVTRTRLNSLSQSKTNPKPTAADLKDMILTLDEVPQFLTDLLIISEDQRFWDHKGTNFLRLGKLFWDFEMEVLKDVWIKDPFSSWEEKRKKILEKYDNLPGASTLEEQLAKLFFDKSYYLTTSRGSRIDRIGIAARINLLFHLKYRTHFKAKKQILKSFYNSISFQSGTVGIVDASKTYFGVLPKDLEIYQAAMLVIALREQDLTPFSLKNVDDIIRRVDILLSIAKERGKISEIQFNEGKNGVRNYFIKIFEEQERQQQIIETKAYCNQGNYCVYIKEGDEENAPVETICSPGKCCAGGVLSVEGSDDTPCGCICDYQYYPDIVPAGELCDCDKIVGQPYNYLSNNPELNKLFVPVNYKNNIRICDAENYVPTNLISTRKSGIPTVDIFDHDIKVFDIQVKSEIIPNLKKMMRDVNNYFLQNFEAEYNEYLAKNPVPKCNMPVCVNSGYRNFINQDTGYIQGNDPEGERTIYTPGGYSEHQLGLAVDIYSYESDYQEFNPDESSVEKKLGKWLEDHAHEYGFVLSFPPETEDITGIDYETWHLRWFGDVFSRKIKDAIDTTEMKTSLQFLIDNYDLTLDDCVSRQILGEGEKSIEFETVVYLNELSCPNNYWVRVKEDSEENAFINIRTQPGSDGVSEAERQGFLGNCYCVGPPINDGTFNWYQLNMPGISGYCAVNSFDNELGSCKPANDYKLSQCNEIYLSTGEKYHKREIIYSDNPIDYTGPWLKFISKIPAFGKSQNLKLYMKIGRTHEKLKEFCVYGGTGEYNTPTGFYLNLWKGQVQYTVGDEEEEYNTDCNLLFRYSNIGSGSWLLHEAEWNNDGNEGCPTFSSHGCVNMRPFDACLLHYGSDKVKEEYLNFQSKIGVVNKEDIIWNPEVTKGAPIIVVNDENDCSDLRSCMNFFGCSDLYDCCEKYTYGCCIESEGGICPQNKEQCGFSTRETCKALIDQEKNNELDIEFYLSQRN